MKVTKDNDSGIAGRFAGKAPASGVTVTDAGGYFTADDLEAILAEIGAGTSPTSFLRTTLGGVGVVQALGTLGATETIDLANGNKFTGTLDQDCTLGTTGWTNGKDCQISLALAGGTGGFTPTISGVTWITAAPEAIAAGTTLQVALWSDDGGTVIWGGVLGGESATGGMTPYYIAAGTTFTVPLYKQALFSEPIEVDGGLIVDGLLLGVD